VLSTLKELHRMMKEFQAQGFTIEKIRQTPAREFWRYVKMGEREGALITR
jgi:hypothetical protein